MEVTIEPMTINDKQMFFDWATKSDATPFWYGEVYGNKVPTWDEFLKDWQDYYFDGSQLLKGRCFKILVDGKPIGQVNYNEIDHKNKSVELDILIAELENKGKGYGSKALRKMVDYLFQNMGVNLCWIDAVTDNPRAISAYQKAGFIIKNNYSKNGKDWIHMEQKKES